MNIVGELKCLHCGRVAGELLGQLDRPESRLFRRAGDGKEVPLASRQRVRCPRCGGPTYVDEIRTVRPAEDWSKMIRRNRRTTQATAGSWPTERADRPALERAS